eukprot:jgi/Picsp_1/607/NSC_00604-R1_protein
MRVGPFYLGEPTREDMDAVIQTIPGLEYNFEPSKVFRTSGNKELGMFVQSLLSGVAGKCTVVDSSSICLGQGAETFKRGKNLLRKWRHFELGWAYTNRPPVKLEEPVAVVAKSLGLWTINPLRINQCDMGDSLMRKLVFMNKRRVSFSHRTLEGHQISGEETFVVEWKRDGSVWYQVETVSRPGTVLAAVTYPILRLYQRKFKQDSLRQMKAQVAC